MKSVCVALGLCLALFGFAGQLPKVGDTLPRFSEAGLDGKIQFLKDLTQTGPVLLYYIDESCPFNEDFASFYVNLNKAYKGKLRMVGIIDADKQKAQQWNNRHSSTFPLLLDSDKSTILMHGAPSSPTFVLVDRKAKVLGTWVGCSQKLLNNMHQACIEAFGLKAVKVDFSKAPKNRMVGCSF